MNIMQTPMGVIELPPNTRFFGELRYEPERLSKRIKKAVLLAISTGLCPHIGGHTAASARHFAQMFKLPLMCFSTSGYHISGNIFNVEEHTVELIRANVNLMLKAHDGEPCSMYMQRPQGEEPFVHIYMRDSTHSDKTQLLKTKSFKDQLATIIQDVTPERLKERRANLCHAIDNNHHMVCTLPEGKVEFVTP